MAVRMANHTTIAAVNMNIRRRDYGMEVEVDTLDLLMCRCMNSNNNMSFSYVYVIMRKCIRNAIIKGQLASTILTLIALSTPNNKKYCNKTLA